MTTIFGIHAFDPKKDTEYILMASDSQASNFIGKKFIEVDSYRVKKLIVTKHKVIAYTGTNLNQKGIKEKTKQAYEYLQYYNSNKEEILDKLKQISKEFTNTYIVGSNFDYQLNLSGYQTKYNFLSNLLKRWIIFPKTYHSLHSMFCGTGQDYAYDIIYPKLQENKAIIKSKENIVMPIEDLVNLSIEGMKEAAKSDKCTGGHMDFAIITKYKAQLTRNCVQL